jgi:hypothetical protein
MRRPSLKALVPAIALALAATACAEAETEPFAASSAENLTEVRFDLPEAPTDLVLDESLEGSYGYGECERQDPPDEGYDYTFSCTMPWSEVAWYRLPAAVVQERIAAGAGSLTLGFTIPDGEPLLRASIHRVAPDGSTTKLTSRLTLFDGDIVEAPLEDDAAYDVYVARGRSLAPVWGTGTGRFELTATTP